MYRHKLPLFALCAAYMALMSACNSNAHDELAHHTHSHEHGAHDHENENHAGEHAEASGKEIVLEPQVAKQLGVATRKVSLSTFNDVLKVSGVISDSPSGSAIAAAPVAGVVTFSSSVTPGAKVGRGARIAHIQPSAVAGGNPNAAARAALEAAKAEVDRLTPLHRNGIVSTAEYNAAVAAYNVAKANYSPAAASGTVTSPVAGTVTSISVAQGQYVQPGQEIARISSGADLLLTADVPQRYSAQVSDFTSASVMLPGSDSAVPVDGRRISNPGVVASTPGYIPVYFSFRNDGRFVSGTPVEVYLRGAEVRDAIVVPLAAVSEQQGAYFVYVRLDEDCYRKVPVTLGADDGSDVRILSGLHVGDNVVVKGMVSVRLAESSGVVPEGHSHNH